jgi:hypothetical protein
MDSVGERRMEPRHSPFLSYTRPLSYWDVVGVHFPLALVSGIVLFVSRWVPSHLLPLRPCTFLNLTGYPCPFCGFTRSFQAMAHGDWAFALYSAPLALLLYMAVAIVFAWNAAGLLLGIQISFGRSLRLKSHWTRRAMAIFAILLILNWAYRLSLGLK